MQVKKVVTQVNGKDYIIETGKMARQADGAVTVTYGETVVLVTAVMSKQPREGIDFFPLTVEYQEKTYAAGRIPGGYFKREGKPTEKEILTARLIDRPIRPLFPEGMTNEVQIMAMVISSDGENDPDIMAVVGASTALSISGTPFMGPLGAVRVGRVNGQFIINPTYAQLGESDLDVVVCAIEEGVTMIESGAKEVSEEVFLQAIELGMKESQKFIQLQKELKAQCKKDTFEVELTKAKTDLINKVGDIATERLTKINLLPSRDERVEMTDQLSEELIAKFVTEGGDITEKEVISALYTVEKNLVRNMILKNKKRVDGRSFGDIRAIDCSVSVLPRVHGSALFTRGQTQSFSVITLGTAEDEQSIEALSGEMQKTFMLHYNFPPFSVGEVKPVRGPGRREIGHGALAERALRSVMPTKEEFPYTVRLVSDILESNGSSSMATACAGSLALMDAGVPIKKAIAGIAMGLVREGNEFVILTDIAGVEDHYGDMDFKVAGSHDGVTAVQVDIKLKNGITMEIIKQALMGAKAARMKVLEKMDACIKAPRESLSKHAPRIVTLKISTEKIKDVIGPGGKIIKKIIADTGVSINIEDDGTVAIASADAEALNKAIDIVKGLTEEPEIGRIYKGTVKRIMNFGAFCEILPGKEGLVHVSELADTYVKNVEDVVKLGDVIDVKLVEVDDQGRLNLSRKQALKPKVEGEEKK